MCTCYFTFGKGQKNEGMCQPIQADSPEQARALMYKLHGDQWAFQYSADEWTGFKNDLCRCWPLEVELELIIAVWGVDYA